MVPMFHANAWGIPIGAPMLGTKQVLPGPHLDGENLLNLMEQEKVNKACGVPTVWAGVLAELEKNPGRWKLPPHILDRKSTRLNSSHQIISYAVFCLKKKNIHTRY